MSNRTDYLTALDSFVGGEIPLLQADKYLAIGQAIKRYSKDRPRVVVQDIDGDGGFDYPVTGFSDWVDGFSNVQKIEYPVDDSTVDENLLDEGDRWTLYRKPTGEVLRLLNDKPLAIEKIRVTYTALHVCTDIDCSVSANDEEAVQALSASFFCDMAAAWYSQNKDSTIAADSVDHKSQAAEYASRSSRYRKIYFNHLGVKEGKPKPACHIQDQDVNYPGGTDRLTHPRRSR